jgi:hypothetical protein
VREEDTASTDDAPSSAVKSPVPTTSATNADVAPERAQDNNNDGGDETSSPLAAMQKRVVCRGRAMKNLRITMSPHCYSTNSSAKESGRAQDNNSDSGDETSSPLAATPKRVVCRGGQ